MSFDFLLGLLTGFLKLFAIDYYIPPYIQNRNENAVRANISRKTEYRMPLHQ